MLRQSALALRRFFFVELNVMYSVLWDVCRYLQLAPRWFRISHFWGSVHRFFQPLRADIHVQ